MFPWWRDRSRRFDAFFGDFDEEFKKMEENMAHMLDEARKMSEKQQGEGRPFVYGFSMRVGPDGKPHVEEFGNLPGRGPAGVQQLGEEREPLTDVIEGDEEITVIAELPGINKNDINLKTGEDSLSIKVDTPDRKYSKNLELPCKVKPETAKAKYNNGVLEVKIKRLEKKETKKKRNVKID